MMSDALTNSSATTDGASLSCTRCGSGSQRPSRHKPASTPTTTRQRQPAGLLPVKNATASGTTVNAASSP